MSAGPTSTGATASDADPALSAVTTETPLTTDTVRELLADRKVFPGLPDDLGEDAELVLDSLGLVWLLHVVEERYGLVVEPTDEDIAGLTSLRRLTGFLRAAQTDRAEGGGRDER
ncbi:acyl carrier protein [Streptomyces sp. NPDC050619]|uniref:acyl carrier protein n=1 Tax=Streptomyces sp. NPDC050619 TaxID=3157214 RepID=UPI003427C2A1